MSARSIKAGNDSVTQPFAPFAISGAAGGNAPVMSFAMPPAAAVVSHQDPESEASRIIAEARARAIVIERQAREDSHAQIQAEVEREVDRLVEPWREQLGKTLEELGCLRPDHPGGAQTRHSPLAD